MQTLFLAACPFCAFARTVDDIFLHSEQHLRSHGPHVHLQRLCALLACVAGALYGQCITLTELGPRTAQTARRSNTTSNASINGTIHIVMSPMFF